MGCPQVSGDPVARVGWHFPLSVKRVAQRQQLHPALTHRWERCRQGRAGSDHAEPPLGLQPAVAVLVGHAGGKAHAAGGRAGAPRRAPLLAGESQQWGHCPGGCKKGHGGGERVVGARCCADALWCCRHSPAWQRNVRCLLLMFHSLG